jgi:hypothetical protein
MKMIMNGKYVQSLKEEAKAIIKYHPGFRKQGSRKSEPGKIFTCPRLQTCNGAFKICLKQWFQTFFLIT